MCGLSATRLTNIRFPQRRAPGWYHSRCVRGQRGTRPRHLTADTGSGQRRRVKGRTSRGHVSQTEGPERAQPELERKPGQAPGRAHGGLAGTRLGFRGAAAGGKARAHTRWVGTKAFPGGGKRGALRDTPLISQGGSIHETGSPRLSAEQKVFPPSSWLWVHHRPQSPGDVNAKNARHRPLATEGYGE